MQRFYAMFFLSYAMSLAAQEVVVRSPEGEPLILEVEQGDTFLGTIELLRSTFGTTGEFFLDFQGAIPTFIGKSVGKTTPFRDYHENLSSGKKEDIRYIVKTLGMGSLVKIAKESPALRKAGKRVEYVHPLLFLIHAFADEELKASMCAMHGRSWVWEEFFGGLRDSFECESHRDNLKPEFIIDFASKVGVSIDLITPSIHSRQWPQLLKILVDNIPRSKKSGRYDM